MKAIKTLMSFILTLVLILGFNVGEFGLTSYAEEISDEAGTGDDSTVTVEVFTPEADEPVVVKDISVTSDADWQAVPEAINSAIKGALIAVGVNEEIIDDIISGALDVNMVTPVKIDIAMPGDEVPKEIFETIRKKNVEVDFTNATGASWTINGQDLADVDFANIDATINLNDAGIVPIEKLSDGDVVEIEEESIDEGSVIIDEEVDQQAPTLQNTPDSSWVWYILIASTVVAVIATATLMNDKKRKHEEV